MPGQRVWGRTARALRTAAGTTAHYAGRVAWTLADIERSIPEAFAAQVNRDPDAPAVLGSSADVSYGELDAAANRCAQLVLDRIGLGAARVVLVLGDGADLYAATLGVLKAGKTVVVVNVGDPPARMAEILDDAEPRLVLTDVDHAEQALAAGVAACDLVVLADELERFAASPPDVKVDPGELAFLMYTSGSTGRPKGVMQTHRTRLHAIGRLSNATNYSAADRLPLFVSTNTTGGSIVLWAALLNGAALCPFMIAERGLTDLASWAAEKQITRLGASSSIFRHLLRTMPKPIASIREVGLGGEVVMPSDVEACRALFGPDCAIISAYGSTEAGMLTHTRIGRDDVLAPGPVPMGRAVDWVELLLLDEDDVEVPPGEIGEITALCDYLSPGFWRDEELTAARFTEIQGRRAVRTGDLGWLTPDGILNIAGRRDLQVKVRGNRIALNEVEAAILTLPGVTGAVACATQTSSGDNRLTAFLTASEGANLSAEGVREALRTRLPQREMPSAIVFVESFPFNAHGKVDRKLLASSAPAAAPAAEDRGRAADSTEAMLAVIFGRAFDLESVGADQDFFTLGGDSLTAHVIAAGVHELLGARLDLQAILDNPTVARLVPVVESLRSADADQRPSIEPVSREQPLVLSSAQERTWKFSQTPEASAGHTGAFGMLLLGVLDLAAFRRAVDHLR